MSDKALIFLSYGGQPKNIAETTYAVLSARRAVGADRDIDLVLYTDRPDLYADLPAELRTITPAELTRWAGPDGYAHRRKIAVLDDALTSLQVPVALVDSDTWFRRPAARLFERIAPGRTVMHLREGNLDEGREPDQAVAAQLDGMTCTRLDGGVHTLTRDMPMWNSGVVGIHPHDGHLVREAMHLTDQLYPAHRDFFTLEQLAVSCFLDTGTDVSASSDVVYHYWHDIVRAPFDAALPSLLERTASLPLPQRLEVLHRHRPRLRGRDRAKFLARELLRASGRRTKSVRSSAT
ncbi:hypothetical protein [Cellulomonas aerilata]|nr:hypothetical protein [Cellulomonas aerilata]